MTLKNLFLRDIGLSSETRHRLGVLVAMFVVVMGSYLIYTKHVLSIMPCDHGNDFIFTYTPASSGYRNAQAPYGGNVSIYGQVSSQIRSQVLGVQAGLVCGLAGGQLKDCGYCSSDPQALPSAVMIDCHPICIRDR